MERNNFDFPHLDYKPFEPLPATAKRDIKETRGTKLVRCCDQTLQARDILGKDGGNKHTNGQKKGRI